MTGSLALFLTTNSAASAQTEQASASETSYSPVHFEAALKLAEALRPPESLRAEMQYGFDGGLAKDLQSDPDVAEMEADYPGITAYMLSSIRSEVEAQVTKSMPELWNAIAEVFATGMNAAELEQAYAYYSSPAGQRLVAATNENADYSKLSKAIVADPDSAVKAKDVNSALRAGLSKTVADMSNEDLGVLMAFAKTPAYRKVEKLGPAVQEASAVWANTSTPENDKRLEDIAVKAIEDFIEKADTKKAAKT